MDKELTKTKSELNQITPTFPKPLRKTITLSSKNCFLLATDYQSVGPTVCASKQGVVNEQMAEVTARNTQLQREIDDTQSQISALRTV